MIAETLEDPPPRAAHPHAAFFRQSSWLMIANIGGGAMTLGVHFLSKKVPESQYAIFGTLLMVTACLPTLPLQMVFAQQTAKALATGRERQLAGMIRMAWLWMTLLWVAAVAVLLACQGWIMHGWQLTSPVALWVTLLMVLVYSLWTPMLGGVLQGRQDFFTIGWAYLLGAATRLAGAVVIVFVLTSSATGMMAGAMIGGLAGSSLCIWQTRDLWSMPKEPFDGRALLRQITPLVLGFGACQFMFTADTMFAKAYFSGDEMAPYVAAGTLSRALLWLVLPLATVMFPKIVHSTIRAEKTNLMGIVLAGTAVLAAGCGLGFWILGPWAIRLVWTLDYVRPTMALLPWYVGALVPLALANVLVNDLLARSRFRVVLPILVLAVAFGFTLPCILNHFPRRLDTVLQTLGFFNVLMLAAAAWAAFGKAGARNDEPLSTALS
jgi:O-antigen/teichoic acid export membrane protein